MGIFDWVFGSKYPDAADLKHFEDVKLERDEEKERWELYWKNSAEMYAMLNVLIDKLNIKYEGIALGHNIEPAHLNYPSPHYFKLKIWINMFYIDRPDIILNIHNVVDRLDKFRQERIIDIIDTKLYYENAQAQVDKIEILLERYIEERKDDLKPEEFINIKNLLKLSIIEESKEG